MTLHVGDIVDLDTPSTGFEGAIVIAGYSVDDGNLTKLYGDEIDEDGEFTLHCVAYEGKPIFTVRGWMLSEGDLTVTKRWSETKAA